MKELELSFAVDKNNNSDVNKTKNRKAKMKISFGDDFDEDSDVDEDDYEVTTENDKERRDRRERGRGTNKDDEGFFVEGDDDELDEDDDDDDEIDEELAAIVNERNTLLHKEIRILQAETIRLEREYNTTTKEEVNKINAMMEMELKQREGNKRRLIDQVAELVVQKENLSNIVSDQLSALASGQVELSSREKEIAVYEEGISVYRLRCQECDEETKEAEEKLRMVLSLRQQEQDKRLLRLRERMVELEREFAGMWETQVSTHEVAMIALDKKVCLFQFIAIVVVSSLIAIVVLCLILV